MKMVPGGSALAVILFLHSAAASADTAAQADKRARETVSRMTLDEKTVLTHGIMPLPEDPEGDPVPPGAPISVGYIFGIDRLGIPALTETDAEMGISYINGQRKDGATGLPSGMAMGSTWNPGLLQTAGAMIGSEARSKGFNVLLAGGANLVREPRNGRTFEYLSEDPLLTGVLVGASIDGIQSNNIVSTIKHYALNGQETGRTYATMSLSEGAARESDLLAFQIGIERGQPGSVMCAYNRVPDGRACDSKWLLTDVLKRDWKYPGFVMSDWGAVSKLEAVIAGLDQQSAAHYDPAVFLGDPLKEKARTDPAYAARLDDMNHRIISTIYRLGLDKHPVQQGGKIDFAAHGAVTEEVARQGIVLLRNEKSALPLSSEVRRIAVIGGYADTGVLTGAGSSEVHMEGGPAAVRPLGGDSAIAAKYGQGYQRSIPLRQIEAQAPKAQVTFRDGRYVSDAVNVARQSDVAIVFATQWMSEGFDVPDLSLPDGQDQLIEAVASANPNTIVVLETGGPVLMPWRDKVAGIVEAWFPGTRGAEALAAILFGKANPSGKLPVTFPASEQQLPRPRLDGRDALDINWEGRPPYPGATLSVDYNIEGSDIGYRWFARSQAKALYPFGYGLSYTSFASSNLSLRGEKASVSVRNTGQREGATVVQLYLTARGSERRQRLVAFQRVSLKPGEQRSVDLTIDPRMLADWKDGYWTVPAGDYAFAIGEDAERLGPPVTVRTRARRWKQ